MSVTVIKVEGLSKQYRLGQVGRKTLHDDVNRWLCNLVGKEDPYLKIGEENDRSKKGNSAYVWALQSINFEIKCGEVLGIIGRNGAGKSTLLKILSKVTAPTKGQIKIKGRIASLLEVGTGFHPELSGRDNIFLNGAILGMTRREIKNKFDEIVDFAGVERYIDTPVKRYSSGMYVRLAFAVAAHLEPDILIVDEVLAVGDAEFQKKCLGKMKDASEKEGRTVLFVSHQMAAISNLCSRALVISRGKIEFDGETEPAVQYYLNDTIFSSAAGNEEVRKGNGKVVVTKIDIQTKSASIGGTSAYISSGDSVELRFKLQKNITVNNLQSFLDFRIEDARGNRVCWLSSRLQKLTALNVEGEVCFLIKNFPLNGGLYYLTYFLTVDGDICDWVQNAVKFEVHNSDFFNTGEVVPPEQSSILIPFEIVQHV